jgi:hypothetical protein
VGSGVRLRLGASAASKEKRLAALLAARPGAQPTLDGVRAAQVAGSLALSGIPADDPAGRRLADAIGAVDPEAPLGVGALLAWHRTAVGEGGFRRGPREREGGPPPAPPQLIAGRLRILEEWIHAPSAQELKPAQQGALALARVIEIMPFDEGNGRVARLAASHLMVRGGARPPILTAEDGPRLVAALQAAFQLHTEPLATLLDEAAERALDALIREAGG